MADPAPRYLALHDFRMQDVRYEIDVLPAGARLVREPGIAGYFYHVLGGRIAVRGSGRAGETGRARGAGGTGMACVTAGHRDTVVISGYAAHEVLADNRADARLLVGSEPFEHLAWLGSNPSITCHYAASGHPLLRRLLLAMDLVIEEISSTATVPDQLTLERTAELIIFYFFRMNNPITGVLDPYPWSDARLMRVLAAMNDDPARPWTVQQLAGVASMSRSAFAARFKAVLGEAPLQLLTAIRLKAAARRMLEGASIIDAAIQSGYGSEEAFNRAFKRRFGITPGRWLRARKAEAGSGRVVAQPRSLDD